MDKKIVDYAEQLWNAMTSDDIESLSKLTNDSSMINEIEKIIESTKKSREANRKINLEANDSFSIICCDGKRIEIEILKDLENSAADLKNLLDIIQESLTDNIVFEFNEKRMMYDEILGIILGLGSVISQRNGEIVFKGLHKEDEHFLKYNMEIITRCFSSTFTIFNGKHE